MWFLLFCQNLLRVFAIVGDSLDDIYACSRNTETRCLHDIPLHLSFMYKLARGVKYHEGSRPCLASVEYGIEDAGRAVFPVYRELAVPFGLAGILGIMFSFAYDNIRFRFDAIGC